MAEDHWQGDPTAGAGKNIPKIECSTLLEWQNKLSTATACALSHHTATALNSLE